MDFQLTAAEARVLGALIEKELTTPEYYPLSLNALVAACNQRSNRDPVTDLTENEVSEAAARLVSLHIGWKRSTGRVEKFEHNLLRLGLSVPELALLAVLLLRGQQTAGELRIRTERMHAFDDIANAESFLAGLAQKDNGPFVVELLKAPGRKEARFMHCFCGEPDLREAHSNASSHAPVLPVGPSRVDILEEEVAGLKVELAVLREEFEGFRRAIGG